MGKWVVLFHGERCLLLSSDPTHWTHFLQVSAEGSSVAPRQEPG